MKLAFGTVLVVLCTLLQVRAQFVDSFTDGDFTTSPTWGGNETKFSVAGSQLKLNDLSPSANNIAGLSVVSTAIANASWEFSLTLNFNPSGSNLARIYLVSNQADLSSSLNGYLVSVGDAGDEICLYRQNGNTRVKVIDGIDGRVNLAMVNVRIRVTRDLSGNWALYSDIGVTGTFALEGTGTDNTFLESAYAGIQCIYTTTRSTHFSFDDFVVTGIPQPDETAPSVQSVTVSSQSELSITFSEVINEMTSSVLTNYSVNGVIANPTSALLQPNGKTVLLGFGSNFMNGFLYHLSLTGIADLAGNVLADVSPSFRYFVAEGAEFNDLIINELFPDPSPQIGLPGSEFVEVFNRSNKAFDLAGWKLKDANSQAAMPSQFILPGEYLILCTSSAITDYEQHGMTLGLSGMPTLNNSSDSFFLIDPSGQKIDSVFYVLGWYQDEDKELGGFTLERLNPDEDSNEPTNWRASLSNVGGTPGQQNSVFGMNPDAYAPEVDTLIIVNANQILIVFDESISYPSGEVTIDGGIGTPQDFSLSSEADSLTLYFSSLTNGVSYTLQLVNISDLAGNLLTTQLPFTYFVPSTIAAGNILFSEIMFDPSPVVQLPEAEFLELRNVSEAPIDLDHWALADGTDTTFLKKYILLPGDYLILTSTAGSGTLKAYGPTLQVANFPSLNNSGERLLLLSPDGLMIDSVHYQPEWSADEQKRDGGWSLERLQFELGSSEPTNWRASIANGGGTPGQQNSVFGMNPDSYAPEVDTLIIVNANQILIVLDESILYPSGEVTIDGGIGTPQDFSLSSEADSLTLYFSSLTNGVSYTLQLVNISDLAGNLLTTQLPFTYFVPSTIAAGNILFSEIMFDPSPVVQLPEAEFLEIRNVSEAPIDLEHWALADGTDTTFLKKHILLPGDYLILTSTAGSGTLKAYGPTLQVANFPSLNNSGERLLLLSPDGLMIDSVHYQHEWLVDEEKYDGGWSLERLHFDLDSSEPTNWRASIDVSGGTPGKQNSLFGANPDIKKPTLESIEVVDNRHCRLIFNELMNETSILTISHFMMSKSVGHPSEVSWLPSDRAAVLTFATDLTNGLPYELIVNGVEDLAGNSFIDTVAIRFLVPVDPVPGNLLITEIMFDPAPAVLLPETEYIELYNNSNHPFDLAGWRLADATDTVVLKSWVVLPRNYVLLAPSSGSYASRENFLAVTGFPSLNNTGERIMLLDPAGTVIDSVRYHIQWLKDEMKMDGGWSLERLQFTWNGLIELNWRASEDKRGGTPGIQNSLAGAKPDNLPPKPLEIVVLNNFELRLSLSEPIRSQDTLEIPNFFLVEANESPNLVAPMDSLTFKLTFPHAFTNGTTYHLRILDLVDTVGNRLDTAWLAFLFFTPTAVLPKDIIITEIMSDPSPSVNLPETEYIEIFNRSENAYDLGGWTLTDGSSRAKLPSFILLPSHYLLFTATSASTPNSPAPILKLPNFPSLNNEGESVRLLDAQGRTIDSVNYQIEWFRGSEKAEGGWSLELIDTQNPCGEDDNWASSEDESGGTPGRDNSVKANKPDITGPVMLSVVPVSQVELEITFSEKLSKRDLRDFLLVPEGSILNSYFADQSLRLIRVQVSVPLKYRTLYTLTAGVFDCNGNSIQSDFNSITFALPEQAEPGDVIINEVLFNPIPNGVDFVELFNRSPKFINLKNLLMGNVSNFSVAKSIVSQDRLLSPRSFSVITPSIATLSDQYLSLKVSTVAESALPSLPDDEGEVVIVNEAGDVIDSLHYDRDFHSPLLKDVEGISLERISEDQPTNSVANWTSALKASGFATPGFQNSNSRPSVVQQGTLLVEPMVISSTRSPYALIHYQFDEPGYVATLKILDAQGVLIRALASNEPLGFSGTFKWEAETDEGTRARQGYYVVWLEAFNSNGNLRTFRQRVIVSE